MSLGTGSRRVRPEGKTEPAGRPPAFTTIATLSASRMRMYSGLSDIPSPYAPAIPTGCGRIAPASRHIPDCQPGSRGGTIMGQQMGSASGNSTAGESGARQPCDDEAVGRSAP